MPPQDTTPDEPDATEEVPVPANRRIADRYRLDGLIGRGAMGTVWSAHDEMLGRRVAVKEVRLPPGIPVAEADALRERTLREARAIAVLSHPNVVTLYDVVRQDGEPFVVMELLPSLSLAELVREQGPLSTAQAAAVGDAVAAALEAAHRAGVTHRDIKPGNVLVGVDGQIKLTDFGIARSVSDHTLTSTGIMLGTPAFISPEVASGDPATPTADLWGLGATLFAALEARPPYDANGDPLETVTEVVHGKVPQIADDHPMHAVISGLMTKDPGERMPLAEVRRLLHPLLAEPGEALFDVTPKALTPATSELLEQPRTPTPPSGVLPALLAADPGPLPFMLATAEPKRRGRGMRVLLAVLAVVLFTASTGGGFALARVIGGQPVLPVTTTAQDDPVLPLAPLLEMVEMESNTSTATGGQDGKFRVLVPKDWTMFRELRNGAPLATTAVHFVSSDGRQELVVERFAGFYPQWRISDYVKQLPSILVSKNGQAKPQRATTGQREAGALDASQETLYRVSDPGPFSADRPKAEGTEEEVRRSTFILMLPKLRDLWVIQVTVPTDVENVGFKELYEPMVASFNPVP
ncbi:tRNA A-37 threonylcarbamoyl transferase component Bud32 [Crossiella equi]|uniref:non-specific serine/threonine protein kinase n=1 Tax=Crossiella equi TaxID=130796 RepID=A0ABS5ADM2_9PSEU|nr:tRNA A-37 threonylcarbamoyl transferase component Bud32 [Crossiella equi]